MLAVQMKSPKVLNQIYERLSELNYDTNYLLENEIENGIAPIHMACYNGNLEILEILHEKFKANFNLKNE